MRWFVRDIAWPEAHVSTARTTSSPRHRRCLIASRYPWGSISFRTVPRSDISSCRATLTTQQQITIIETSSITRCRVCRTYINPFVTFLGQGLLITGRITDFTSRVPSGTKWKCNLCDRVIDLPADFDYDMVKRRTVERADRPELNSAVVEYIAPPEYCVRRNHGVTRSARSWCIGSAAPACELHVLD
jgi:hypothetical protein